MCTINRYFDIHPPCTVFSSTRRGRQGGGGLRHQREREKGRFNPNNIDAGFKSCERATNTASRREESSKYRYVCSPQQFFFRVGRILFVEFAPVSQTMRELLSYASAKSRACLTLDIAEVIDRPTDRSTDRPGSISAHKFTTVTNTLLRKSRHRHLYYDLNKFAYFYAPHARRGMVRMFFFRTFLCSSVMASAATSSSIHSGLFTASAVSPSCFTSKVPCIISCQKGEAATATWGRSVQILREIGTMPATSFRAGTRR